MGMKWKERQRHIDRERVSEREREAARPVSVFIGQCSSRYNNKMDAVELVQVLTPGFGRIEPIHPSF